MKLTTPTLLFLSSQVNAFSSHHARLSGIAGRQSVQLSMGKSNTSLETNSNPIVSSLNSASIAEPPLVLEEKETEQKSYLDDGFVFGMEGSGLKRPKGKVSQLVLEGDSLEAQPYQVAVVSATFLSHALVAGHAFSQLMNLTGGNVALSTAQAAATVLSSWLMADLGSGILHWSVDNYGNGRTPIFGGIIAAFQGHHSAQWTITERAFFNNVWKLCIPFGIPTVLAITLLAGASHPLVSIFFAVFCSLEILSQEFHKWSHMTKKEVHPIINKLQDCGLTIARTSHARHHVMPYDGNYCIVSGFWNDALDNSGVFRMMEKFIYERNGVESNAWKIDPKLRAKTLSGDFSI